jgi:hypothetical protein
MQLTCDVCLWFSTKYLEGSIVWQRMPSPRMFGCYLVEICLHRRHNLFLYLPDVTHLYYYDV